MRQYDIVTGILLILSTIDFALAAPVLAHEERQARVDVVHIPKDVVTLSGRQWEEELEKVGEEYFKTSGKPVGSSGTHSSSSAPNPASSTVNVDSSMEQSCSSPTSSTQGLSARGNCISFIKLFDVELPKLPKLPPSKSSDTSSDYEPPEEHLDSDDYEELDGSYFKSEEWTKGFVPPVRPPLRLRPRPPRPPPTELNQPKANPSDLPSTSGSSPVPPPTEPEHEVVPGSPTSPDSGLHLDHQSLSADSQPPVDPQATIIYEAKGKAKVLRGISGTAGGVVNAT